MKEADYLGPGFESFGGTGAATSACHPQTCQHKNLTTHPQMLSTVYLDDGRQVVCKHGFGAGAFPQPQDSHDHRPGQGRCWKQNSKPFEAHWRGEGAHGLRWRAAVCVPICKKLLRGCGVRRDGCRHCDWQAKLSGPALQRAGIIVEAAAAGTIKATHGVTATQKAVAGLGGGGGGRQSPLSALPPSPLQKGLV